LSDRASNSSDLKERDIDTLSEETIPTAPLPDPIGESIDTVTELRAQAEEQVPGHQRLIESITHVFVRPAFLYIIVSFILVWTVPNALARRLKSPQFDPPPFNKLHFVLTASSLLMTTGVLIRQKRQEELAEQRAQLSMQINLISEQKIAKLISLVEELREDLPNVHNRRDPEAEVMEKATDPREVLQTLEAALTKELSRLKDRNSSTTEKD